MACKVAGPQKRRGTCEGRGGASRHDPPLALYGMVPVLRSGRSQHSLRVVLGAVAEFFHRVGDVPVPPAVAGDGVEDPVIEVALDRAPGNLGAVARAEPHETPRCRPSAPAGTSRSAGR